MNRGLANCVYCLRNSCGLLFPSFAGGAHRGAGSLVILRGMWRGQFGLFARVTVTLVVVHAELG